MAYKITDKCISCGACAAECPVGCISQGDDKFVIDESACISCGTCAGVCPVEAPVEESDAFLFENVNKELGRAYNRKDRKQFLS